MSAKGQIVYVEHVSEVLKRNPLGDPHVRRFPVYLPPDYDSEENRDRTWPICVILHGSGSTETAHGSFANTFGRHGVIYVAPDTKSDLPEAVRSCMQMVLYHVGFPSPKKGTARVFAPIHVHR